MMRGTMSSNFLVPNVACLFPSAPRGLKGGIAPNSPQGESSDFKLLVENLRQSPKWLYAQNSLGLGVFSPFGSSEPVVDQELIELVWGGQTDLLTALLGNPIGLPEKDGLYCVPVELRFTANAGETTEFAGSAQLILNWQDLNAQKDSPRMEIPASLVVKIEDGDTDLSRLLRGEMAGSSKTAQLVMSLDDLNGTKDFGEIEIPVKLVIKVEREYADFCDFPNRLSNDAVTSMVDEGHPFKTRLYSPESDVSNGLRKAMNLPVVAEGVAHDNTGPVQAGKLIGQLKELKGKLAIELELKVQPQAKETSVVRYRENPRTDFGTGQLSLKRDISGVKGVVWGVDEESTLEEPFQSKNDYPSNSQNGEQKASSRDNPVVKEGKFSRFSELIKDKETGFKETRIWPNNLWAENKAGQSRFENLEFNRSPFSEIEKLQNLTEDIFSRIRTSIFNLKDGFRSEAKIRLQPESLGSVRINLVTENSNVCAKIVVDNLTTKQIIQSNLPQLKESLSQQGLNLEKLDISLGGESSNSFSDAKTGFATNWGGRRYVTAEPNADLDARDSSFGLWKHNYVLNCLA